MKNAIEVRGLRKHYGRRSVLRGVDLTIPRGEIFALLGVNGAGKTTTLECMEGLKTYDGGTIALDGRTGIQLQTASLPEHMRPMEAVRLFSLCGGKKPDVSLLDALGIRDLGKKLYRELSTGQRRRLHLALALVNDPDILFLDEPTAGLDVEGRISLHEEIRKLRERGKTVILASHDMAEVETLCDRIAILNEGIITFCGTPAELTEAVGKKYTVEIRTSQGTKTSETEHIADTLLSLLTELKEKQAEILDIRVDRGTLEQHFLEMAGRAAE